VLGALAAFSLLIVLVVPNAFAVHDTGAFELDGNATNQAAPGDDWDNVCHQVSPADCPSPGNTNGATAVSWVAEPNPSASIFTGGGSKDPQDVSNWAWKDAGGLPDKDNLLHSFAARYSLTGTEAGGTCPNGTGDQNADGDTTDPGEVPFDATVKCEVLYFGSDRFDNSGDAQQGFWFFQNPIGLTNTPSGGGFKFSGVHKLGDLLVISDFSNGGTTSTISVYRWNPAVSGNLQLLQSAANANCASAAAGDAFCGIVNPTNGTTAPWPYTDKSGNHTYLQGELYEGGVNLSSLGLGGECFSSVASETRSSTSTTATLKDFVLGGFGKCESGLVTTPSAGKGGSVSIGTGSISVTDSAELTISGVTTWSGTMKFFICGPIASGTCDGTTNVGTQVGSDRTVTNTTAQPFVSDPKTITEAGRYCWRGEFIHTTNGVPDATDSSANECFTVTPVTAGLTTNATGGVLVGNPITDVAHLSGTATQPDGSPAGGTITFNVFGPDDATCSGSIVHTNTVNVTGNGDYNDSFTPTAAGTYRWVVSYSGNPPNTVGTSGTCNDANESAVVNPKQPSITTDASADPPTGVSLGTPISDTATLSGTSNKPNGNPAGGTITFKLYGPDDATCTGTVAFSSTVNVTGDGQYNSGTFTPTAVGTYRWTADYSGDSPNTLGASSPCNAEGEASLVFSLTPTVKTSQFFYPNDTAHITVAFGGGALAGTVRLRAWTNATCDGVPLVDQTIDVATGTGGNLDRTVETTNTTARVSGDVNVYWRIDYDSTNSAHNDVTGTCGMESSVIDVTDLV
jgi:hypothetical protein